MAACDVSRQLRSPTMGETSGSAIRALSLGKPLVVSRRRAGSPSCRTRSRSGSPVDEREVETLAAALELFASDDAAPRGDGRRRARPHRARALARPRRRAVRGRARGGGRRRRGRARHCSTRSPTAAAEVGIEADDPEAGRGRGAAARGRARRLRRRPAGAPARALALARAVPVWAWLVGLVAVSTRIRYVLARRMVAPWIMVDELIYSELAKSFAAGGHFLVRGARDRRVRLRLPDADRARVGGVQGRARRLRGREGDQRARDVARGRARLLPRPADVSAVAVARRRGARGRDPVDGLHGDADDGERASTRLPHVACSRSCVCSSGRAPGSSSCCSRLACSRT